MVVFSDFLFTYNKSMHGREFPIVTGVGERKDQENGKGNHKKE